MHADVDERAEVGDVGDDALEDHAGFELRELFDAFAERRGLELGSRVAARLFEFLQDVAHGRQAEALVGVAGRIDRLQRRGIAHHFGHGPLQVRENPLHDRVGLRVHGGRVERIVAGANSQEARRLLERLRPQSRHGLELVARLERAVRVPVGHDVLGERRRQARDPRQQRSGRRVHVDADGVDAVLDHGVELARELGLADVVLVLAHADRLRVDLHEFGQRILQPARDRDGATDADVDLRELARREFGRRVHRRTGLGHDDLGEPQLRMTLDQVGRELVGFARGGAVADADEFHAVLLDQLPEHAQ